MIMVVRMLTVALIVLASFPSTLRAAPSPGLQSVFGFCKARITVDFPPGLLASQSRQPARVVHAGRQLDCRSIMVLSVND